MYEQINSFYQANKKVLLTILGGVIVLLLTFLAGYNTGLGVLSNHTGGADAVRDELKDAGTSAARTTGSITDSQNTNSAVGTSISAGQDTARSLDTTIDRSQELLDTDRKQNSSSAEILRRIRARGKAEVPDN